MAISTAAPELKININAKEIKLANRTIRVEPLVEELRPLLEKKAMRVIEEMGIQFGAKSVVVEIDDKETYWKSNFQSLWPILEKAHKLEGGGPLAQSMRDVVRAYCLENTGKSRARFDHFTDSIRMNFENLMNDVEAYMDLLSREEGGTGETVARMASWPAYKSIKDNENIVNAKKRGERDLLFEAYAEITITNNFSHEFAHANHYFYAPTIFEGLPEDILKAVGHRKLASKKVNEIREGVAYYIQRKLIREDISGADIPIYYPGKTVLGRIQAFRKNDTKLGEWFVTEVAKLVENQPVKLIIDNPPTAYQLLYPGHYVRKMERLGKV